MISVHLRQFEGPLSLLLYLIRKEEMAIFDINIHEITRQYFDYIRIMRELDLEVAGEFVSMAATLIHIKSKMLLPQYDEQGEVIADEDPRKELVQKLLEYQKYQEASKTLYERPLLGRDVWKRGLKEGLPESAEEIQVESDGGLFALISAYRLVLRNIKNNVHRVKEKLQSIASRIMELRFCLVVGERIELKCLIDDQERPRPQLLITFLSLLELCKMGFVSVFQSEPYSSIHIQTLKAIEEDSISQVEEYEANQNEGGSVKLNLSDEDFNDFQKEDEISSENLILESATDEDIVKVEQEMGL